MAAGYSRLRVARENLGLSHSKVRVEAKAYGSFFGRRLNYSARGHP